MGLITAYSASNSRAGFWGKFEGKDGAGESEGKGDKESV